MTWDAALARADAATAAYFDTQAFVAVAMTKPARQVNAADIEDASRPAFTFMGSLDLAPEFSAFATANRPNASDRQTRQVTRICLTALSSAWPWMLRQNDRIRSADALYVVAAAPESDGSARVALWLNKVST